MTDTAQPSQAAETEVASDSIADAANAFKTFSGDAPTNERPRNERGQFTSANDGEDDDEIDAEDEPQGEAEAESHDDIEEGDEASDEDQPEAPDLPSSWPAEQAEMWNSLPTETRAFIAEREGQRDSAVNAKFQEAANLRKAHEAEINEAKTNRQHFAEAADFVLSLATPQEPPVSMLNPHSHDYNPDEYHLAKAQYDQQRKLLAGLYQQRQQIAQQESLEQEANRERWQAQVEEVYGPLLLRDVPELADPQKQAHTLSEIARWAVENGVPAETFTDPDRAKDITSADLRIAWKAMQWDRQQAAKNKVKPKAAKPSSPPVRPGPATSRIAVQNSKRKAAMDRLDRTGSIEDGAAVFKQFFKG